MKKPDLTGFKSYDYRCKGRDFERNVLEMWPKIL